MTSEKDAIPFEASDLRGERLLVLAPHPDDEVIACGGLVALHLAERRSVRVVIATDGAEADGAAGDRDAYRLRRELESRRGVEMLGGDVDLAFLRFADRRLGDSTADAKQRLRLELVAFKPDLLAVPAPTEIHPDHFALARIFCELIQHDEELFALLAVARVAFYEVSQPIRPNTLVDITAVADTKYSAVSAHESQISVRDYVSFARGLNAYRAMTLPPDVRYAEAYYVVNLPQLRTRAISALAHEIGDARSTAEVIDEVVPISVIVRTKDRPALLREAVASIQATGYPAEVIVVNDGGTAAEIDRATVINHDRSLGRSEAMNRGVRAAKSLFIAFLDDDDLFYPEHLATLARASRLPAAAWYTDAVSAFVSVGPTGSYAAESRLRLLGGDFDRDLLLADNYIPLPTLLVRREDFLDLDGFDSAFDLFEDWEFLIRLSKRGDFIHVPRVTCEIRHVRGAGSVLLATPAGSDRFVEAKLQVWRKHADTVDPRVFAAALEHHKHQSRRKTAELVEAQGLQHHFEINVTRLEREKEKLIGEIEALHESLNAHAARLRDLEPLPAALARAEGESARKSGEIATLSQHNDELLRALQESQTTIPALYAEIHRLQGLLDMIYESRTWKLHSMVERIRARSS